MNADYIEELGRALKNTYGIKDHEPKMIGKLAFNLVKYFQMEEERDAREAANKAQWGDEASERRIDIIGANSNEGLHYE